MKQYDWQKMDQVWCDNIHDFIEKTDFDIIEEVTEIQYLGEVISEPDACIVIYVYKSERR